MTYVHHDFHSSEYNCPEGYVDSNIGVDNGSDFQYSDYDYDDFYRPNYDYTDFDPELWYSKLVEYMTGVMEDALLEYIDSQKTQ